MKTTAELAAEQAAYWNGPGGDGWLAAYERIQRSLADIGDIGLAAAAPRHGEHVIDIGCGTGGTTAALAHAVGIAGHVLGVDISQTLIEAARAHRLENATFVVGDAATHPFKAEAYDLVYSRFGVMFFADPVSAFRNIRRALKPTGRLAFIAWRTPQENPWGTVPARAAQPFLPPQPRPGPEDPGQFSFGDARARRAHPRTKRASMGCASNRSTGRSGWGPASPTCWPAPAASVRWRGPSPAPSPPPSKRPSRPSPRPSRPMRAPTACGLPGACWLVQVNAGREVAVDPERSEGPFRQQ